MMTSDEKLIAAIQELRQLGASDDDIREIFAALAEGAKDE